MTYTYDEIQLSVIKDLNTKILNSSFQKLVANDEDVVPVNDYFPNIWERKWFNDDSIAGYKKGHCVWKNAMAIDDLINQFGDVIYRYAHEHQDNRLNEYLLSSWTDILMYDALSGSSRLSSREKPKFLNVMSGYSEISTSVYKDEHGKRKSESVNVQYYDKLFDCGFYENKSSPPRIEMYVSMKDDNKDELSCADSWKTIVLTSYSAYREYLSTEMSIMFEKHLEEYHFGGLSTIEEYDEVLLARNLSNFDINEVYNRNRLMNHSSYVNLEGFDYVVKQHRQTYLHNGQHLYRGFLLWSSGKLDHYGTVAVPLLDVTKTSNPDDYAICVDLGWQYEENGELLSAETYNYSEISGTIDDSFAAMYYADDSDGNSVVKVIDKKERFIAGNNAYSVSITPMQFDVKNDLSDQMFADNPPQFRKVLKNFDYIKKRSYPSKKLNNKNMSYLSPDVHCLKNDSFMLTKFDTDALSSNSRAQYFSYYVSGYKTVVDYFNISVEIEPLDAGIVSADKFVVQKGGNMTLSAFPSNGYKFSYWSGYKLIGDSPLSLLNVTKDIYLTAHFLTV